jgi:hypothetical protein
MNDKLVYSKTAKGVAEVATRSSALSLAARRVLIMVDGKRSVADLAPLMRAGEIDTILSALEAQGFVTRGAGVPERPSTVNLAPPAPAPAPSLEVNTVSGMIDERNVVTLEEAKRRAVRQLIDRLGPDGELMAMRIEQCANADLLRDRVREAERLIAGLMGDEAAADYLRALRTKA